MTFALIFVSSAVASCLLTRVVLKLTVSANVFDVPNERSSHTSPTPRGGGASIVIISLACVLLFSLQGVISGDLSYALGFGGGAVAALGLVDDLRNVGPIWRFIVQIIVAIAVTYFMGGMPTLTIGGLVFPAGTALDVLCVAGLVWLTNLYNFMDGIDGIAGMEAMTSYIGIIIIAAVVGLPSGIGLVACSFLGAVLGFLVWNFPRARIFMGDVGSGYLGLTFGVLAVYLARSGSEHLVALLILLAAFVTDSTFTLIRRGVAGRPVHLAHRTHAYQLAAGRLKNHRTVTVIVTAINLLWLTPLAVATATGVVSISAGMALAYIPLLGIALYLGAGSGD